MLWSEVCSHGHRVEDAEVARSVSGTRTLVRSVRLGRMTVRKQDVCLARCASPSKQCKLGTFSTAAASATAGRSALIGTRGVRIRGPYFRLLSFHDLRSARPQCPLRVGGSFHSKTETVLLFQQLYSNTLIIATASIRKQGLGTIGLLGLADTKRAVNESPPTMDLHVTVSSRLSATQARQSQPAESL